MLTFLNTHGFVFKRSGFYFEALLVTFLAISLFVSLFSSLLIYLSIFSSSVLKIDRLGCRKSTADRPYSSKLALGNFSLLFTLTRHFDSD